MFSVFVTLTSFDRLPFSLFMAIIDNVYPDEPSLSTALNGASFVSEHTTEKFAGPALYWIGE